MNILNRYYMHSNTSIILSDILVGTFGRSVRKTFIDSKNLSRPMRQADAPTERPYKLSLERLRTFN